MVNNTFLNEPGLLEHSASLPGDYGFYVRNFGRAPVEMSRCGSLRANRWSYRLILGPLPNSDQSNHGKVQGFCYFQQRVRHYGTLPFLEFRAEGPAWSSTTSTGPCNWTVDARHFEVFDDGTHGDERAGDFVFSRDGLGSTQPPRLTDNNLSPALSLYGSIDGETVSYALRVPRGCG